MSMNYLEAAGPGEWLYDVRDQLKRHIYGRSEAAFASGDAARDAVESVEELEARRTRLRAAFIEAIGGLPPSDTPLNARVVGTIDEDGFRIEKVIFESRPGSFVTANLYVPYGISAPRGAVIFLCGHHQEAKHAAEYQIVCRYLVKAGLVVLAQDPIGQGERFSYYEKSLGETTVTWGVPEHDHAGSQCLTLGDALARYFVHDAMRGVDYLRSRPEVDPDKIGVTGNSGGGTQSCLMMVCDTRLAAAAPTTFVMNRRTYMFAGGAQDAEQIWYGMTALGFDHEDVLLMMAPKPVRVQAVTWDFFPIEGTRQTVERCKRLWELYGKGDHLDLVEDDSLHAYTRPLARAAAEFFSLHLLGEKRVPRGEEISAIPSGKLWCTESGQVRGELEGARFVYEENQDRLAQLEKERSALPEAERMERALSWLRGRVFANRKPCDINPRLCEQMQAQELSMQSCMWWSQEGIFNHAHIFRDFQRAGQDLPVTLAIWDGGTTRIRPHINWIRRTCAEGRAVMVLNVSGSGVMTPNRFPNADPLAPYGVMFKFTDDLFWLDDSLAAMRTYDVLRALDMIQAWKGLSVDDTRIYAHGRCGVYGHMARALDQRIRDVRVVEGLSSYAEWVRSRHYDENDVMSIILPGALKYFDLPDLENWSSRK